MEVVFAPDWREGVPYQRLLADALARHEVRVTFLRDYRRGLPLSRLMQGHRSALLHLHWPEAYYPRKGDGLDWLRRARFSLDLAGALRRRPLATTAHNLCAHNRSGEHFVQFNSRTTYRSARVVFAHSEIARLRLVEAFDLEPRNVRVIPHGDLSVTLGAPLSRADARRALDLPDGKLALMFGTVEPYKGQEEVIAWWKEARPDARLAIVGNPMTPDYQAEIRNAIGDASDIIAQFGFLPDEKLKLWLSAADAAVFNYRQIFTSGAASLARSWGLPLLIPSRLETVALAEPSPFVHRFTSIQTDFAAALQNALRMAPDFAAAAPWREACSWDTVARLTADGYSAALAA